MSKIPRLKNNSP